MTKSIVIVSAKRTAIGSFNGVFSNVPAHDLGAVVIQSVLEQTGVAAGDVDQVILGQVLTAAQGQNPARRAAMGAGLPYGKTALTINQVCGSGLRAVAVASSAILSGDSNIIVAGGQENMTLSPHAIPMRAGVKMGNAELIDTMITDGLWDAFNQYHMGITAENIAQKFGITREEQDMFAAHSQQKTQTAIAAGKFADEITPVTIKVKKEDVTITKDEFPREGVTAEALSKLRPAFKPDGSVTAGNASGLNDGAAVVLVMTEDEAKRRNLKPMARIASWATEGVDPAIMGTGPIPASRAALKKAGWGVNDLDLIESNEAFAAQACCVIRELGLDPSKVNVNGGAIALGHPIGASGCRVLVTLLHEMNRSRAQKGLVTLCIGGGMGIAMCLENYNA